MSQLESVKQYDHGLGTIIYNVGLKDDKKEKVNDNERMRVNASYDLRMVDIRTKDKV